MTNSSIQCYIVHALCQFCLSGVQQSVGRADKGYSTEKDYLYVVYPEKLKDDLGETR